MKQIMVMLVLLTLLLGLTACGGNQVTGKVTADLTKDVIKNGESINLKVNGKNTGNTVANVVLNIVPEDPALLKITYLGSLEDSLQAGEEIGTKIIQVQGFTQHSQTKLWIKTQLIDKASNKVLDESIQWITIQK